jgi:hypothetical protein
LPPAFARKWHHLSSFSLQTRSNIFISDQTGLIPTQNRVYWLSWPSSAPAERRAERLKPVVHFNEKIPLRSSYRTSVVTANPAIEGHLKTGHRAAART